MTRRLSHTTRLLQTAAAAGAAAASCAARGWGRDKKRGLVYLCILFTQLTPFAPVCYCRDGSFAGVKGAAAASAKPQRLQYMTSPQSSSSSTSNAAAVRSQSASSGDAAAARAMSKSVSTPPPSASVKTSAAAAPQRNRTPSPTSHAGLRGVVELRFEYTQSFSAVFPANPEPLLQRRKRARTTRSSDQVSTAARVPRAE
jgi:hypothetical protein